MPLYKGVSILWLEQEREPDKLVATDATLEACGGYSSKQYFHTRFPDHIKNGRNIAHLEMYAMIVGLKLWGN